MFLQSVCYTDKLQPCIADGDVHACLHVLVSKCSTAIILGVHTRYDCAKLAMYRCNNCHHALTARPSLSLEFAMTILIKWVHYIIVLMSSWPT